MNGLFLNGFVFFGDFVWGVGVVCGVVGIICGASSYGFVLNGLYVIVEGFVGIVGVIDLEKELSVFVLFEVVGVIGVNVGGCVGVGSVFELKILFLFVGFGVFKLS